MVYEAYLTPGALEFLKDEKDLLTNRELCRTLDIAPSTLSGIINDRKTVGSAFILGVFKAYGYGPDHEIYTIKRKEDPDAAPRLVLRQQDRQPVRH